MTIFSKAIALCALMIMRFFFTLGRSENKTNKKPEPATGNEVIHVAQS